MKLTVADFPNDAPGIAAQWQRLAEFLAKSPSDVLVLPEMVAAPGFWVSPVFDEKVFHAAVRAHGDHPLGIYLGALKAKMVLGSRPVLSGNRRLNETFVWTREGGFKPGRAKAWLPQQEGGWEATWFDRGQPNITVDERGGLRFAFLICSELMVSTSARSLGQSGAQLIAVPRATGGHPRWTLGTRMAAINAGAFVATANRYGEAHETFVGGSWIVGPEGDVLASTTREVPFVTAEIDLAEVARARTTYPRNVAD